MHISCRRRCRLDGAAAWIYQCMPHHHRFLLSPLSTRLVVPSHGSINAHHATALSTSTRWWCCLIHRSMHLLINIASAMWLAASVALNLDPDWFHAKPVRFSFCTGIGKHKRRFDSRRSLFEVCQVILPELILNIMLELIFDEISRLCLNTI